MRSLIQFLLRYKTLILFLVLEAVALVMISGSHNYHQTFFFSLSRNITGFVARQIEGGQDYLHLRQVNKELLSENTMLRNRIELLTSNGQETPVAIHDSVSGVNYVWISARVISNSVNKQKNFITLNKGSQHGIAPGMGVVSAQGVAGMVVGVSRHYSVVMSVLNADFRLSASLAANNYFGSLAWNGISYRYATLSEIPHHVSANQGDTVVTSGFSTIFPPGLMAGTVSGSQQKGGDFISMEILLAVDFKNLTDVYVITNLTRDERENLETEVEE